MTVITPDEFVAYSLELLVEPVRGANSSTGQHNIAAPTSTEDYRKPSLRPVPRVHSSPHPDADVLALDRHHNGGERGDQESQHPQLRRTTGGVRWGQGDPALYRAETSSYHYVFNSLDLSVINSF